MKFKQRHSHLLPTLFAIALFLLAISVPGRADDKKKPQSAPKPASKPAATSHSSGGSNTSHGSNTGRPSSNGRPGGNSSNGRPSGGSSNSNTSHASGGNSNGRPGNSGGSNNGRSGSTNNSAGNNRGGNNANNGRSGSNNNTSNRGGNSNGNNRGGNNANSNNRGGNNNSRGGSSARREPARNVREVGNHRVATDNRGRVREISGHDSRGRDLAVHRDLRGGSRFETRGAGGRRVVGYGGGRGFTERRFVNRGGHVYVQRTYVYGGRSYAYAYRSYYYHGYAYYGYAPAFYYHPGFYGWAYNPWAVPVTYGWGWGGNPWYGYYGYYFNPYPVYPSASLWLTDYLLAESLRAAYDSRDNANADAMQQDANNSNNNGGGDNGGQAALSPEVKQMIADEVKRQLDAERNAAAQPAPAANQAPQQNANANNNQPEETPAALDPAQRVFVVAGNVDMAADSGECGVTAGDVLVRSGEPNGSKISVSVVSSKKGDCAVGTNADVEISDLQEMHNQFRQKMDSGLKTLADNSGKNGLPKAPDTATTTGEVPAPQPDSDAGSELQNQQKDAEGAEQDVQKGSPGGK
ncbi:MAG TPA: hypothetical protein VHA06_19995 [Candidatus Angelobacter sp.]|nr:hypothetical protein [Candidatus Angelobacter sp.]